MSGVIPASKSKTVLDGGHVPGDGKWSFDAETARVFDNMLERSIPQYAVMRKACFDVGSRYVQPGTDIVDLGCSRGQALEPFVRRFGEDCRCVGVETSPPMLAVSRERFKHEISAGLVQVLDLDLRRVYPSVASSLTLAILTLQFIPIEHRQRVVRDIARSTIHGGALIVVEKVLGATADTDAALVETYHALKADNGYSGEQIERKRLSLEGVLVPVTARWNEDLLRANGFGVCECFWRWMNFAAWVAVKE